MWPVICMRIKHTKDPFLVVRDIVDNRFAFGKNDYKSLLGDKKEEE